MLLISFIQSVSLAGHNHFTLTAEMVIKMLHEEHDEEDSWSWFWVWNLRCWWPTLYYRLIQLKKQQHTEELPCTWCNSCFIERCLGYVHQWEHHGILWIYNNEINWFRRYTPKKHSAMHEITSEINSGNFWPMMCIKSEWYKHIFTTDHC